MRKLLTNLAVFDLERRVNINTMTLFACAGVSWLEGGQGHGQADHVRK
jgi:hypothetical protein